MLLIFSKSFVGRLSVRNCLEQFLCLGPFGSIWSFIWSPIQVLARLVRICSFLVLVCREWRRISWTRSHDFHHGLVLSSFIFFLVSFLVSRCVFLIWGPSSPSSSLVILFIHSAFSLCFLVAIFSSKIVRFLWHPVVGMFSCHSLPIVDRMFFRCFGMFCFVCIVLHFVVISLIFFLLPVLSGLFPQVEQLFFLVLPVPFFLAYFSASPFFLAYFRSFYLRFQSNFPSLFWVFLRGFEGIPIFSQTNFAPAYISSFNFAPS